MILEIASLASSVVTTVAAIVAVYVALKVNHDASLPQPIAYLEHDRDLSCIRLVIKNFGAGVAIDIEVTDFDFSIVSDTFAQSVRSSFVNRGIPSLVPGAQRDTLILAGSADMRDRNEREGHITFAYKERTLIGRLRKRRVSFVLDIRSFAGSVYPTSDKHKMATALKDIAKCDRDTLVQQKQIVKMLRAVADFADPAFATERDKK